MSWSTRFDEPIRLDGKALHTLRDAAEHVIALPPKETKQAHWQTAMSCLIVVAERRGPLRLAGIAIVKALAVSKAPPSERLQAARSFRIVK